MTWPERCPAATSRATPATSASATSRRMADTVGSRRSMRSTVKNSVWRAMKRTEHATAWRSWVRGSAPGSIDSARVAASWARIERTSSANRASLFSKYQ